MPEAPPVTPDIPNLALSGGGLAALVYFGWWFLTRYLPGRDKQQDDAAKQQSANFAAALEKVTAANAVTLKAITDDSDAARRTFAAEQQAIRDAFAAEQQRVRHDAREQVNGLYQRLQEAQAQTIQLLSGRVIVPPAPSESAPTLGPRA